jgi:hypothetical protein
MTTAPRKLQIYWFGFWSMRCQNVVVLALKQCPAPGLWPKRAVEPTANRMSRNSKDPGFWKDFLVAELGRRRLCVSLNGTISRPTVGLYLSSLKVDPGRSRPSTCRGHMDGHRCGPCELSLNKYGAYPFVAVRLRSCAHGPRRRGPFFPSARLKGIDYLSAQSRLAIAAPSSIVRFCGSA